MTHEIIETGGAPIRAWTSGVPVEEKAREQLHNMAQMPFVHSHIAIMPDVHWGMGATVGSVIPTTGAIIPAAVGVDIGCGMAAVRTNITASRLPDSLAALRTAIEATVPHGRTDNGGRNDVGAWRDSLPAHAEAAWLALKDDYEKIIERHPKAMHARTAGHIGTLGTGNHFIELCLDEESRLWIMLHSGSRGPGNKIGTYFIELAKKEMKRWFINLPDVDLAYLAEGSEHFGAYVGAVRWAQAYARANREAMMTAVIDALRAEWPDLDTGSFAVNCHHNYVAKEHHFGKDVWITRKGAVRAGTGELGIIPGSMGAKSFIVRGRGNRASFETCSHGAGRAMSRTEAKKRFSVADHVRATEGVECRKDAAVIDETPMAYKDIDAVMAAQADLVEIVHTLKQILCVKG